MLNSEHQAEDKLIILYVLLKIKTGITREQVAFIIIENLQMSYFDIQLYIDDLIRDNLVRLYEMDNDKKIVVISAKGRETLEMFVSEVPTYIKEMLDLYISQNRDRIFKEVKILGNYTKNSDNDYQVQLKLHENNIVLMELSINTPSQKQALNICDNWKNDTQNLYASVIKLLTKQ
ncbi:MAG: DUF4364 family protein [Eubacterium sp.]